MFENIFEKRNCPICNNKGVSYLYTHCLKPIENISLLHDFNVVVCENCGFTYVNTIPNQSYIDDYYRNFSKYEISNDSKISIYKKYFVNFIADNLVNRFSFILDIGY